MIQKQTKTLTPFEEMSTPVGIPKNPLWGFWFVLVLLGDFFEQPFLAESNFIRGWFFLIKYATKCLVL